VIAPVISAIFCSISRLLGDLVPGASLAAMRCVRIDVLPNPNEHHPANAGLRRLLDMKFGNLVAQRIGPGLVNPILGKLAVAPIGSGRSNSTSSFAVAGKIVVG